MSDVRMDSYHGEERRRAPRMPLCLSAAAECDAWMGMCHTKDISESGVFVISQMLPSMQTGFFLELRLPGRMGRIRARAVTVRVQGDYPRGFAVIWKELGPEELDLLRVVQEKWDQAFGDTRA